MWIHNVNRDDYLLGIIRKEEIVLKSQSFLAVLIQTYSAFDVSKYRCVFLIQNCYLQVPALSINLLKEFDILIDFLFK